MKTNKTNIKPKPVSHGELILIPSDLNIEGETSKHKTYIAAHSETGHNHVIESDVEFDRIMTDNGIYVRLYETARVVHQKTYKNHETVVLAPGVYKIGQKTEYNPITKLIGEVRD